ncbi:hypothetical protein Sjap_001208 [Stephania japonica]|uniref:ribonuclease P n=1 Tax=Stephania japonica TaxID=461633 RepID=A0AAP0PR91_9MAGN
MLNVVVKELRQRCHGKWPLVVLNKKRYWSLMKDPSNRELLEEWTKQDVLYTTPNGSNDDWYWIYAAVKLKCLLVSNDEMRDHIFELLRRNFFLKWKERHQVHFIFRKGSLQLQMPPPYSVVMQESEKGHGMCLLQTGATMRHLELGFAFLGQFLTNILMKIQ